LQLSRKLLWLEPYCSTREVHQTSSKAGSGINILYLLTGPIRLRLWQCGRGRRRSRSASTESWACAARRAPSRSTGPSRSRVSCVERTSGYEVPFRTTANTRSPVPPSPSTWSVVARQSGSAVWFLRYAGGQTNMYQSQQFAPLTDALRGFPTASDTSEISCFFVFSFLLLSFQFMARCSILSFWAHYKYIITVSYHIVNRQTKHLSLSSTRC